MWVKICANTNFEDALLAVEAGADAVGFVFAPSKRQVNSEQVADITRQLPAGVEKIGVFATDDPLEIEHIVASSGLTAVQLHSKFDADMARTLSEKFGSNLRIIQTVTYSVDAEDGVGRDRNFIATLKNVFAEPAVWAILVDAAKSGKSGGLGLALDWNHVGNLVRQALPIGDSPRVILAGGLRPETVADAIAQFKPSGVDVASGVEAFPGRKDIARLQAFITEARGIRRE